MQSFSGISNLFRLPSLASLRAVNFSKILQSFRFGTAFFVASAVFFVLGLSFITLIFSTHEVTKGYVLRDLESKRQVLLRDNNVISMQVAQAQALQAVYKSPQLTHMRHARNITYMRGETTMASR
ncbi:MAG: hypothetical protein AAB551_03250 [Patescibacteria group bacterium]